MLPSPISASFGATRINQRSLCWGSRLRCLLSFHRTDLSGEDLIRRGHRYNPSDETVSSLFFPIDYPTKNAEIRLMTVLSRKFDKPRKIVARNVQVNILLTEEEAKILDEESNRRQEQNPGIRFSRGALVRDIVLKFLTRKNNKNPHIGSSLDIKKLSETGEVCSVEEEFEEEYD